MGITYEPIPRSGLEFLKVGKVEMQVFALKGVFDKTDFSKIPFVAPITPVDTIPSGARGLDGWPDNFFQRRVLYRVDLLSTAMHLVAEGQCAIFIPEFVARSHNAQSDKKLSRVAFPANFKKVQRDISLVHKVGAEESSELKRIARMIRGEINS
jgi:DNA-binding transcriptional LysR family regulator